LGHVGRPAAHQQGRDYHEIAGYVGGKQAEAEVTNHVHHPRDTAEETRKEIVNWHDLNDFGV
jgi:hypothetical protein